jgi:hypothetical protein
MRRPVGVYAQQAELERCPIVGGDELAQLGVELLNRHHPQAGSPARRACLLFCQHRAPPGLDDFDLLPD